MVEPAWFFSTLAQAVAASIGFVIAFTAAVYAARRGRFQQRLRDFQADVGELYDTYGEMVTILVDWFADQHGINPREAPVSGEPFDDFVRSLAGIEKGLQDVPSLDDLGELQTQFQRMGPQIDSVRGVLSWEGINEDWEGTETEDVWQAIRGEPLPDNRNLTRIELFRNVQESHSSEIGYFKERYPLPNQRHVDEFQRTVAWKELFDQLEREYRRVEKRHGVEWLTRERDASHRVVEQSIRLFFVGVAVPMAFLVSLPAPTVDILRNLLDAVGVGVGKVITIVQVVLLGASLYYSWGLFQRLADLLNSQP